MTGAALWLAVGALGAVGSVARFALDGAVARRAPGELPWGTLAVNVLGSLALGILAGAGAAGDTRILAAGALVGSFTTFSTWMLETHRLLEEGLSRTAAANLLVSVALGIAAIGCGWWIGASL